MKALKLLWISIALTSSTLGFANPVTLINTTQFMLKVSHFTCRPLGGCSEVCTFPEESLLHSSHAQPTQIEVSKFTYGTFTVDGVTAIEEGFSKFIPLHCKVSKNAKAIMFNTDREKIVTCQVLQ